MCQIMIAQSVAPSALHLHPQSVHILAVTLHCANNAMTELNVVYAMHLSVGAPAPCATTDYNHTNGVVTHAALSK